MYIYIYMCVCCVCVLSTGCSVRGRILLVCLQVLAKPRAEAIRGLSWAPLPPLGAISDQRPDVSLQSPLLRTTLSNVYNLQWKNATGIMFCNIYKIIYHCFNLFSYIYIYIFIYIYIHVYTLYKNSFMYTYIYVYMYRK